MLDGARVVVQEHGGPGAARNAGVQAHRPPARAVPRRRHGPRPRARRAPPRRPPARARRPRRRARARRVAPRGRRGPHHAVARLVGQRSSTYGAIAGDEAGLRPLLLVQRVAQARRSSSTPAASTRTSSSTTRTSTSAGACTTQGMRLRVRARTRSRATCTTTTGPRSSAATARRARGERLMADEAPVVHAVLPGAHPTTPRPAARVRRAVAGRRRPRCPRQPVASATLARRRANRWYHQQLAPAFLNAWEGERDLDELKAYLGDAYDHATPVTSTRHEVEREEDGRAATRRRSTGRAEAYLYDLTVFAMSGTKAPYLARPPPPRARRARGCSTTAAASAATGCGCSRPGYRVAFADFDNPSTRVPALAPRPPRPRGRRVRPRRATFPAASTPRTRFDVIEHVDDPFAFLAELERRADDRRRQLPRARARRHAPAPAAADRARCSTTRPLEACCATASTTGARTSWSTALPGAADRVRWPGRGSSVRSAVCAAGQRARRNTPRGRGRPPAASPSAGRATRTEPRSQDRPRGRSPAPARPPARRRRRAGTCGRRRGR